MATQSNTAGSAGVVATRFADLPQPLALCGGRSVYPVRIAYETYGELNAARDNAVLVCHALTGDAHAAGIAAEPPAESTRDGFGADEQQLSAKAGLGWWDGMIGPGKAFDTDRYFVIATNLLGGCRGSTGPCSINPATGAPYGIDFPALTVLDLVRAQRALLDQLGVPRLLAVAGGSLGGMQAIEWALEYPQAVDGIIPIASTAALGPQGVAWNAIARNAIMADPDWQGGRYHGTGREPRAGMGIARMVGHITYLSAESMASKFGRRLQDRDAISFTVTEADFEVESYLRYQASKFVKRFDANTYLLFSRALSWFDPARDRGAGSLERALEPMLAATLLICYSSDWLYPPQDSRRIEQALRALGKHVELHEIVAPYGHDAFLLEEARQTPMIRDFLARLHQSVQRRGSSHDRTL